MGYRPDIEGLRAVAILLVVAVHARIPGLAGGFVGVDVFFVLSGYLITALLVQEIKNTGDLNFAGFYARRLRRLLPALFLMLISVGLLGWLLLPFPLQFRQVDAAGNAALWLSNFFFAFSNLGYFSPGATHNLFLQTWSLGVEEQFYLLWPLIIIIAAGAWKGAKRPPRPGRLKLVMPLVFAASLPLCIFWSYRDPHLGFYMMPSRAWQFSLGALVFLYFGIGTQAGEGKTSAMIGLKTASILGWLGLLMILSAAFALNHRNVVYPGIWAMLPSFGAAMVILAGTSERSGGVGTLLSKRPMQALGRVSYSWYLWHWPLLVLAYSVFHWTSLWSRLGVVLVSLLVAAASYRFVESPIRRRKKLVSRPRLAVAGSIGAMGVMVAIALLWHAAITRTIESPRELRYSEAASYSPLIYSMGCDSWYHNAKVRFCKFGPKDPRHTAVIIGDSITLQWFPAVMKIFDAPGWRLIAITKSACPMVDDPVFYNRIHREYTVCSKWRSRAVKDIEKLKPDVLIFSSLYQYPFSKRQWITGTRKILHALSPVSRQVYILRSTPILPFDGPGCAAPRGALYRLLIEKSRCHSPAHSRLFDRVYRWLKLAARPFGNVRTIDMTSFICPHNECRSTLNGDIVFRDDEHMTVKFARSLAPDLKKRLLRAGLKLNYHTPRAQ